MTEVRFQRTEGQSDTLSVSEPAFQEFPEVRMASLALSDLEYRPLVDSPTMAKYRIQQKGLGDAGHVFLVTLYGSTCSKLEMGLFRRLGERDYLAAVKRAIEREIGYFLRRGAELPRGADNAIETTVRDTDFVL